MTFDMPETIETPPRAGRRKAFCSALVSSAVAMLFMDPVFAGDAPVRLDHDEERGSVEVRVRGEHVTTYHYGEESRTPFLWPVLAEDGVGVTRNYPMGEDDPESTDHPHHRSLWLTYGDVNGYDFWHDERIKTVEVETGTGDGHGWIRARNLWLTPDDDVLLEEVRELRFYDTTSPERMIDVIATFVAPREEVVFGDDKEGLLAVRIRPEIEGNRAGTLTNARGDQGERAVYGHPVEWMDYAGPVEGRGVRGIALFDHPGNFRAGYWHVRDYGLAAINPFASREVGGLDRDGSYTLEPGESLTLRYRVLVHSGADSDRLSELYRQWIE